ncbi:hypothetical protein [Microbacterium sp. K24]|uniref:hypothetical protein n=1 Tax=Microbacterium sp. K24 TaxID=2305446 RepID=UPI00109C142D|nr:hypothetical protein [Microbacterium sp. K24]
MLVVWGINGAWWLLSGLLDGFDAFRVILGVAFLGLTVAQVFVLRKVARAMHSFEETYGKDAGRRKTHARPRDGGTS